MGKIKQKSKTAAVIGTRIHNAIAATTNIVQRPIHNYKVINLRNQLQHLIKYGIAHEVSITTNLPNKGMVTGRIDRLELSSEGLLKLYDYKTHVEAINKATVQKYLSSSTKQQLRRYGAILVNMLRTDSVTPIKFHRSAELQLQTVINQLKKTVKRVELFSLHFNQFYCIKHIQAAKNKLYNPSLTGVALKHYSIQI